MRKPSDREKFRAGVLALAAMYGRRNWAMVLEVLRECVELAKGKAGKRMKQAAGPDRFKAQFENTFKHFVYERYVRDGRLNAEKFLAGLVRKNYGMKAKNMITELAEQK